MHMPERSSERISTMMALLEQVTVAHGDLESSTYSDAWDPVFSNISLRMYYPSYTSNMAEVGVERRIPLAASQFISYHTVASPES